MKKSIATAAAGLALGAALIAAPAQASPIAPVRTHMLVQHKLVPQLDGLMCWHATRERVFVSVLHTKWSPWHGPVKPSAPGTCHS